MILYNNKHNNSNTGTIFTPCLIKQDKSRGSINRFVFINKLSSSCLGNKTSAYSRLVRSSRMTRLPTFTHLKSNYLLVKFYSSSSLINPLSKSLSHVYLHRKLDKPILIAFKYELLSDFNSVNDRLSKIIQKNVLYTVAIKIRYSNAFFMAGKQFGFNYKGLEDVIHLTTISTYNVNKLLDVYSLLDEDISYVQFTFKKVSSKIISDFGFSDSNPVPGNQVPPKLLVESNFNIPISVDNDTLGQVLPLSYDSNNLITNIELLDIYHKEKLVINFLDRILEKSKLLKLGHPDKIQYFDKSWIFYLVHTSNISYVLAVKKISSSEFQKVRYSLAGYLLNNLTDCLLDDNIISRKEGNNTYNISNGNILSKTQAIKLLPIQGSVLESNAVDNPNIGVIDTETYRTDQGKYEIYCLGFKTNLSELPVTYYVDKNISEDGKVTYNSDEIVLNLINELLRPKYDHITFYCHNFGKFDVVFILKVLTSYNDNNMDKYNLTPVFRDNSILSLTITKVINNSKRTLIIKNSYALLTSSLSKLGKDFNVNTMKGDFPYRFALESNLNYIGNTPSRDYYNEISDTQYNSLITKEWDFKQESTKYLNNDLMCLYEVITKANKQIFLYYGLDMYKNSTISKLAVSLYLSKYYNNNIPNINKRSMYNDIKEAYYGAITEVYKPSGENSARDEKLQELEAASKESQIKLETLSTYIMNFLQKTWIKQRLNRNQRIFRYKRSIITRPNWVKRCL